MALAKKKKKEKESLTLGHSNK